MNCTSCGALQAAENNNYCEECGTRLVLEPPPGLGCAQCGAGAEAVDDDGFCTRCGFQRVAPDRDHVEIVVSLRLAGVSDRGKRHHRNEDALALAAGADADVLVVCDGVSSSQYPDEASTAAAEAACATLEAGPRSSGADDSDLIRAAIHSARAAVLAISFVIGAPEDPPETTIVLAVRRGRRLTVGWVGDSRAYYLSEAGARPLTQDHSWATEAVAQGLMTSEEALRSPKAHYVTRTLGGPAGMVDEPSVAAFEIPAGRGLVLLCSDGLWNHAPDPEQIAALARAQAGADALGIARGLVDFALDRGGQDNITVAVLAI